PPHSSLFSPSFPLRSPIPLLYSLFFQVLSTSLSFLPFFTPNFRTIPSIHFHLSPFLYLHLLSAFFIETFFYTFFSSFCFLYRTTGYLFLFFPFSLSAIDSKPFFCPRGEYSPLLLP